MLSHASALALWEMGPAPAGGLVHVTLPGTHRRRPDGVIVHRSDLMRRTDMRFREGLPVTSPARTLLDHAAQAPRRDLERAYDQGLVKRLVRPRQIHALIARSGRHPGVRPLSQLLIAQYEPAVTESEKEEAFLALVREAGLPSPKTQAHLLGFRIDFLWPREKVAVEIDSWGFHGTPARFESDRRRDATLRRHGFDPIRFTWRQARDEPVATIALVVAVLTAANARSG